MSCHHGCRCWLRLMGSVLAHLVLYASPATFGQSRAGTRSVSDGRLRQPSGMSTEVHLTTRMPHTWRRRKRPVTATPPATAEDDRGCIATQNCGGQNNRPATVYRAARLPPSTAVYDP